MKPIQKDSHVILAFGANQPTVFGEPAQAIRKAIAALSEKSIKIKGVSRLFTTPAFPAGAGPDYVNAAVSCTTCISAHELLTIVHKTESDFCRVRDNRWASRTLDIDLIAYDDLILPDRQTLSRWVGLPLERQKQLAPDELILPHPRLQDRAFVLVPMAEVAPHWRHPLTGKTVLQMLAALDPAEKGQVKPF